MSITPKFSKGPWYGCHFADETANCKCASVLSDNDVGCICTVSIAHPTAKTFDEGLNGHPKLPEAKANAKLIMAAPDMFHVLYSLLSADLLPSDRQAILNVLDLACNGRKKDDKQEDVYEEKDQWN